MQITSDSVSSNVVTLTVAILEGNIPAVGDLIYVYNTENSSGDLNEATGLAIASVSIVAATGKGTITYPKTVSDQGDTADTGYAISVPGEVAETLVPNQAYQAFALPKNIPLGPDQSITMNVSFPSAPASVKIALQAAIRNIDAEYVDIIKDETAAGTYSDSGAPGSASTQLWPGKWNFVRFKDTGSSGGSQPTVIAKLLI